MGKGITKTGKEKIREFITNCLAALHYSVKCLSEVQTKIILTIYIPGSMIAHKFKITNPQDYGLYLLENGEGMQLF